MDDQTGRVPAINAPAVVIAVLAVLVAMHVLRQVVSPAVDREILIYLAFLPIRFGEGGGELPGGLLVAYTSLFSHALLHVDWMHLILNSAWMLAFGALIARRTGPVRFILLLVVAAAAGALAYLVMSGVSQTIVVGASGAVSGLMGAGFRLIFVVLDRGGIRFLQDHTDLVPRMPLAIALRDGRVLMSTAVWIAINLLFGIVFPNILAAGGIAWEAHLGGFFAGLLLFQFFDRGRGWH